MANSNFLRNNKNQHSVKNSVSKKMDSEIDIAMSAVAEKLAKLYPDIIFTHKKKLSLVDIITELSLKHPKLKNSFSKVMDKSFIKPDGGFLFARKQNGKEKLILIAEVKHQGTNDKRATEGLPKQAKGNAIERLGKNLTAIRAIFKKEKIIPFVCFGSGHDFNQDSTIVDRVITMNDFFPINKIFIEKVHLPFEPVSMFFRYENWSKTEMVDTMLIIARQAMKNHFN